MEGFTNWLSTSVDLSEGISSQLEKKMKEQLYQRHDLADKALVAIRAPFCLGGKGKVGR